MMKPDPVNEKLYQLRQGLSQFTLAMYKELIQTVGMDDAKSMILSELKKEITCFESAQKVEVGQEDITLRAIVDRLNRRKRKLHGIINSKASNSDKVSASNEVEQIDIVIEYLKGLD